MATQADIENEIQKIADKWSNPVARNGLYGNILKSVSIKAIRGIDASIEFSWPITAIAGTNGSGKTTILQLCSAVYVKNEGGRNYKIGDWVRSALGIESPAFDETSVLSFSFWNDVPTISIPYQKERTRWGYPRRNNPERSVYFFGITTFAPRIERKDRLHVFRSQLEVKSSAAFTPELLTSISSVLGVIYPEGNMHTVGPQSGNWSNLLPQVKRDQYLYGEPHMGAGEQKVIRLIQALENLPSKSLVLLEEPEITLHPDAQKGLAWYLMSLSRRKGHQIIIATHSAELFETLPIEARVLLVRSKSGIKVIPRTPHFVAARELAGVAKTNKDLILVEDVAGKAFLLEILRRYDRPLLDNCSVIPVGNTDDVYRLVKNFRTEGVRAVGVRDPDVGEDIANGIFSLPGDLAPESLLLQESNIAAAGNLLNGLSLAFEKAKMKGLGHSGSKWAKAVFLALAHEMKLEQELLGDRLTIAWLEGNAEAASNLVEQIRHALGY